MNGEDTIQMGYANELITMDVYDDNANIIPEEIPELLSYMDEVMPDKSRENDNESNMQDIMIDMDSYLPEKKIQINVYINFAEKTNKCLLRYRQMEGDMV